MKFISNTFINESTVQQRKRNTAYAPKLVATVALIALAYYLYPTFNSAYPYLLLLLTLPYCLAGASMALALAYTLRQGYWLHTMLMALGIIFICGIA